MLYLQKLDLSQNTIPNLTSLLREKGLRFGFFRDEDFDFFYSTNQKDTYVHATNQAKDTIGEN